MFIIGTIWLWHMVMPDKCDSKGSWLSQHLCRWLIPEQVVILQDILTGGIIAGLVAEHIKRRLKGTDKEGVA